MIKNKFNKYTALIVLLISFISSIGINNINANAQSSTQEEAKVLANKIKQSKSNTKIATVNNNGKLTDIKKNTEGKVYLTEHNSNKSLIDPNEIHANSCEFWIQAAVMTIGLIIFTALAITGVGAVLDTLVLSFGYTWVYLDAALVASGVLSGWSVLYLGQWIAAKVCGNELPPKPDTCHWCGIPD